MGSVVGSGQSLCTYRSASAERSFSDFFIRSEYLFDKIHNQFWNDIFSLFHFILQQSISDTTARCSKIPASQKY